MPKLTINDIEVEVPAGTSIIQAAEQIGVEIPRFCYHDKLSVPANCRMCLVQVEGAPKPVASCAMPCADNMKVLTESDVARKARKGVMEMLLINHPLDCPICDQGGECDLQDQAVAFGYDRSRYEEEKRAVKDKELGPLVKTTMTRCIHCTRCVRFGNEIAGVDELGVLNRGEHLEIGTYVEQMVTSELSGNLIDVCPVGALTSKPYAFTARPWELKKTETIDVMDAVGSNIRVDARGNEIMRVLPRLNEDVNEEWISDTTRFAYDGLKNRRLDRPYVRDFEGKLKPADWDTAFKAIASRIREAKAPEIAAIAGDLVDCESTLALRDLMTGLNVASMDCRQRGEKFDVKTPAGYLFNTTIAGLEAADVILLVGVNLRYEAPMINARIRKAWLANPALKIALIGENSKYNYPVQYLGSGTDTLSDLLAGGHDFAKTLENAKNPVIIFGGFATARMDGSSLHGMVHDLATKYNVVRNGWNGFNMLHTAAGRVGALMLGFTPQLGGLDTDGILDASSKGAIKVLYLHGADEIDFSRIGKDVFVIYQGHHGDRGAHRADVILPGAAYTEKHATYVNTEGRAQIARQAVFAPGEAREDWKIIRALADVIGVTLGYNTLAQLRAKLATVHAAFRTPGVIVPSPWGSFGGKAADIKRGPIENTYPDFYQSNVILRASATMAACVENFSAAVKEGRTGTHG